MPVPSFTYDDLQALAWGRGFGPFDSLVAAHDAAASDTRRLIRRALFRQHPDAASDWAFQHVEATAAWNLSARARNAPPNSLLAPEYSPSGWVLTDTNSLAAWADYAPIDWLLDHQDLLLSWLQSGDRGLQMAAARRISELEDPTPVLEISVKLLEAALDGVPQKERGGIYTALQVVAKSASTGHIPLLKVYADGGNFIPSPDVDKRSANQRYADYQLRRAATAALRALGAIVPDVPHPPRQASRVEKDETDLTIYERMQKLDRSLWQARASGDRDEADVAAREIINLSGGDAAVVSNGRRILGEAYKALEEWDKAIELIQSEDDNDSVHTVKKLLPLLIKAGRLDDIEDIIEYTRIRENATRAALVLIDTERVDRAYEVLTKQLMDNPNLSEACIGLALIHLKRNELVEGDSMMERAIALRPSPTESPFFRHTITYWVDRGQPEKARAWVRESAANDSDGWWYEDLFDWAADIRELADTVAKLLASGACAPPY